MHWIVYHIASGHSFFSGLAFTCVAVMGSLESQNTQVGMLRHTARRYVSVPFVIGMIAIALSSTPLAYWFYGIGLALAFAWMLTGNSPTIHKAVRVSLLAWCFSAALFELPHHWVPAVERATDRTLVIIGDSVTAGMGGQDSSKKWPAILAEEHSMLVQNLSHPGATAGSELKRVIAEPPTGSLAVIEIGGNDALGTTSTTEFERDLSALIKALSVEGRQLVMLELPLIPFYHEYGRIQRTIAKQYSVRLVPKARFLSVIGNKEATVDSIHLTQYGHEQMAEMIWGIIQPAYR